MHVSYGVVIGVVVGVVLSLVVKLVLSGVVPRQAVWLIPINYGP